MNIPEYDPSTLTGDELDSDIVIETGPVRIYISTDENGLFLRVWPLEDTEDDVPLAVINQTWEGLFGRFEQRRYRW